MVSSFSFFIDNPQILTNFISAIGIKSAPAYSENTIDYMAETTVVNDSDFSVGGINYRYGEPVPKTEPVENSFFRNTLFVGDSLTLGIKNNHIFPYNNVLAHHGIDPETAMTLKIIETDYGSSLTLLEAMTEYNPEQIYIMLGANGVGYMSTQSLIGSYEQFVDDVILQHPDSKIFIQSILPVTAEYEKNNPYHTNKKIDEANKMLRQMCSEKKLYYLDVCEVFKDDFGDMYDHVSPSDGLHISANSYELWAEYLRCHVVE